MIRKHFRLKRVLLGLALAAVAAPAAQASTGLYVDGPTPGIQSHTIASEISVQAKPLSQLQIQGMRWNAMAAAYQSQSPVRSENSFGAPGPSTGGAQGPISVQSVSTSSGFNWNDAGIGASVAFGVALLLLLSVAVGRRYYTRSGGGTLAST